MAAADIFKLDAKSEPFALYDVELQVRNQLVGGIPKDPKLIRAWLRQRLEMDDAALADLAERTYREMHGDGGEPPTTDDLLDAISGEYEGGNGFKTVDGVLVYEGRCMKAAIKEAANIAYPGNTFPNMPKGNRKGLMRWMAETVFVVDEFIPLGVSEPSRAEERVKHVKTPQGPRSTISVVDLVDKPLLSFRVEVLDDRFTEEVWARLWSELERNGIGADRARGDGVCELVRWERVK